MRRDRSVTSFNIPQNLVIGWVYDLPFGRGRQFRTGSKALDLIEGEWQVNGIADIRSGSPVNVTIAGDIANTGNVNYLRPNVVGDWKLSNPTPQAWFNKAAFAPPAPFTFGNAPFGASMCRCSATPGSPSAPTLSSAPRVTTCSTR